MDSLKILCNCDGSSGFYGILVRLKGFFWWFFLSRWDHGRNWRILRDSFTLKGIFWDSFSFVGFLMHFWWIYLGYSGILWDFQELWWIFWDFRWIFWDILGFFGIFRVWRIEKQDFWWIFWDVWDFQRLWRIF